MGVAALVLGIISVFIAFGGGAAGMGWIGSICGILAIIFGSKGSKNGPDKKLAKAGLILGIIALFGGLLLTIACLACIGTGAGIGAALGVFD